MTADARLSVGTTGEIVEVTGGSEVVQTTTAQLSHDFGARAVTDLPSPGLGGGPLNLALLVPNTTTHGAGVLGEGGSIGGARPRLNSFNIDGVDDNRVDVTGHTSEVIPEAVADFNLVTNMFSAELGHSAGGQFNIVTKSGTNDWHGSFWEFNNNRNFQQHGQSVEELWVDVAAPHRPQPGWGGHWRASHPGPTFHLWSVSVLEHRPGSSRRAATRSHGRNGLLPCCLRFAPTSRPVNGKTHY